MNKKLLFGLCLAFAFLPLVLTAALYGRLPPEVPMHWGLHGEVGYEDKVQLFLVAGLAPLLLLLFRVLPKIDPRRQNYARFQGFYDGLCLVMMVFLLGIHCVLLSEALFPGRISVERLIIVAVGALFLFLGNLMPKVKNNFFMGVRTPWTLSDPDVWNRANRLGGQCCFAFGLLLTVCGFLLPPFVSFLFTMAGVVVVALVPTTMSYIWYRKKRGHHVDNEDVR